MTLRKKKGIDLLTEEKVYGRKRRLYIEWKMVKAWIPRKWLLVAPGSLSICRAKMIGVGLGLLLEGHEGDVGNLIDGPVQRY